MRIEDWFEARTYHHSDFSDLELLVDLKRRAGLSISLGLPTLNVGRTVGPIVESLRSTVMEQAPLLDQIAIIDSRSQDDTVARAREAGAEVYQSEEVLPEMGGAMGKGEALWKSMACLTGDIVLWIDSDIENMHPRFVYGLAGPLLAEPELAFVKAFYVRPLAKGQEADPDDFEKGQGGGRVTELCARPALNLFYPELSGFIQPLSGEQGGRREVLERVRFFTGYGVETGLLIGLLETVGLGGLGQVDLERRVHRNQPIAALSRMSFDILQTLFMLLEGDGRVDLKEGYSPVLQLPIRDGERYGLDAEQLEVTARPPMGEVPAYRRRRGLA